MKLIPWQQVFYVECHTDNFGYKHDDCYAFNSCEEVENFLGMHDDYKNQIYKEGEDISGNKLHLGCDEYPNNIYSQIEYEIDWQG